MGTKIIIDTETLTKKEFKAWSEFFEKGPFTPDSENADAVFENEEKEQLDFGDEKWRNGVKELLKADDSEEAAKTENEVSETDVTTKDDAPFEGAAVRQVELDADGIPHDPDVHASNMSKTKDRRWKKRPGVDQAVYEARVAELKRLANPHDKRPEQSEPMQKDVTLNDIITAAMSKQDHLRANQIIHKFGDIYNPNTHLTQSQLREIYAEITTLVSKSMV